MSVLQPKGLYQTDVEKRKYTGISVLAICVDKRKFNYSLLVSFGLSGCMFLYFLPP